MASTSPNWAAKALDELCVRYGYCLPPDDYRRLIEDPPQDPEAFVDAVLVAEGLNPVVTETRVLRDSTRNFAERS